MAIEAPYDQDEFGNSYAGSGEVFIALPFPTLPVHWANGDSHAKSSGGAMYFGGWKISPEEAEAVEQLGREVLPYPFGGEPDVWVDSNDQEYRAHSSRSVFAAPIWRKDDWWDAVSDEGKKVKKHRIDVLCYLGDWNVQGKKLVPYGLGVLSAWGFAASGVNQVFARFERETAALRSKVAPKVSPSLFYVHIGTFGDKRITKEAGQSVYVPAQWDAPKEINEKYLTASYVGAEIAGLMLEAKKAAEPWVKDTRGNRAKGASSVQNGDDVPETPPASDDDVSPW